MSTPSTQLNVLFKSSLSHRKSPDTMSKHQPNINEDNDPSCKSTLLEQPSTLARYEDIPTWYQDNEYILDFYRPVTGSVKRCLHSLIYLHNETVNIYSHLIPALCALSMLAVGDQAFQNRYPDAYLTDRIVFAFQLVTATTCMALSSAYHILMNHSAHFSHLWSRIDYSGIMVLIFGDFISGIYFGLYCEPTVQSIYWTMITICTAVSAFVVLSPSYQHRRYRLLRLFCFTATGLSAFAPIYHAMRLFPYEQLNKQSGLNYYLLEGAIVLVAVAFYATQFPESRWPGRFDLWGASHQIFHVLVVIATLVHVVGLKSAFEYNYATRRCSATSGS